MDFLPTAITPADLVAVGFLVFLEGILSFDNAIVLALIVRPLPPELRKKALSYGIIGSIVFRIIAIFAASYLLQWRWVKFVGAAYLIYLAIKFFWDNRSGAKKDEETKVKPHSFWITVLIVEISDIVFAVDSILTAVALTQKMWVVITGGVLGIIAMRFGATLFLKLLERFPRFESAAFLLVFVVGMKLLLEGLANSFELSQINFHDAHFPSFWLFWGSMAAAFATGFLPGSKKEPPHLA